MAENVSGWAAYAKSNPVSCHIHYPFYRLWHGSSVLTQTVWERMSIKYNRDIVTPAELVQQCTFNFNYVHACFTSKQCLLLTCSGHQSVLMHMCVLIWAFGFGAQPFVEWEHLGSSVGRVSLPSARPSFWGCCLISVRRSLLSVWPLPSGHHGGVRGHMQVSCRLSEEVPLQSNTAAVIYCKIINN